MRFWDSSAIVPLFVQEASSESLDAAYRDDDVIVAWWGTKVECASALIRLERGGDLTTDDVQRGMAAIDDLASEWIEVAPTTPARDIALRLVRVHDLRVGDAFQLAAAICTLQSIASPLPFVTLDDRLALAASREGFPVLGLD